MPNAAQQSVHLTGGTLRVLLALYTPKRNSARKLSPSPARQQVTLTVRQWLNTKAPETELIKAYYREVTASTWVDTLPTKSARFVLFTGAGFLLDTLGAGGLGTALGIGISAADTFLLDPILKGWKPNHFVEGSLKPFVEGKKKEAA